MYNADEIFKIAIFIEEHGSLFYKKAADVVSNLDLRKSLLDLAKMEEGHINVFKQLRKEFAESSSFSYSDDNENEDASSYLKAIANTHIFTDSKIEEIFAELTDAKSVLDIAMRFEKDSIIVFTALKEEVPEALGKEKINLLIVEELKHILHITKLIKEFVGE